MPIYQFTIIIEQMASDVIRAYCASLLKHGEPVPVERVANQFVGHVSVALGPA